VIRLRVARGTELDFASTKLCEMHFAQLHDLSDVTVFAFHPEASFGEVLTDPLVFLILWVGHSAKYSLRTTNLFPEDIAAEVNERGGPTQIE
jgi:hypothetical protein